MKKFKENQMGENPHDKTDPRVSTAILTEHTRDGVELAGPRGDILWNLDKNADIRFSHENPEVRALYNAYFHKPLSHRSHELLHTDLTAWKMPTEE